MSALPWYAVHVASNHEKLVAAGLDTRGYDSFLPLFRSRRRWADRYKDIDSPLFPGYVFCRLNVSERLPVLMIPGVVQIVGCGKNPMPVDPEEIAAIEAVVKSGLLMQPWPFLKVGQAVRIQEGPLRNVTGILSQIDGADRLVVSISLLQRSVAVTLPRYSVRPLAGPGAAVNCSN